MSDEDRLTPQYGACGHCMGTLPEAILDMLGDCLIASPRGGQRLFSSTNFPAIGSSTSTPDMYAGSNSSVLNVHIQHADLGCRRKRGARQHEARVRNSKPNKLRSCGWRNFWREMFPVLRSALCCRDIFSRQATLDVTYNVRGKERCFRGNTRPRSS